LSASPLWSDRSGEPWFSGYQTLQADIYVSPPQTTANRVLGKWILIVDALKTWDGIRQVVTYNDANVQIVNFNHQAKLISADDDVSQGKRPYGIRPDLSDPWNALAAGKGVIISEALILRENLHSIPEIALETPLASGVSVLAIFYDYSLTRDDYS